MRDFIVSKGKNLKEAINIGLHLMQAARNEVDIEIIERESKGFLGIGARPAVVKLIKKTVTKEEEVEASVLDMEASDSDMQVSESAISTEVLGMAWVKDGRIQCKESPTRYPTITPAKGVPFYKNGEIVKSTTVISEKDELRIELKDESKETTWVIAIGPSEMVATLDVQPGYKKTYRLLDQEPSHHIQLEIKETEEVINDLQTRHIAQRMQELGIITGIEKIEIIKACETLEPGIFEIAKGISPKKGEDGWLELIVDTELKHTGPKHLENGYVNHREIKTIPNVEKGQVIGFVHPPKPGNSGITVTGKSIQPEPSKDIVIHIRRGADLIDEGSKIVALESGRPHIEYRNSIAKVSILPKLLHSGDVDLASGNLYYVGDIEILGNVEEGMTVEAAGDVLIHGLVDRSTITAGNRIIVYQNVINSRLTAGESNLLIAEMGQLLGKLVTELRGFSAAIDQVYLSSGFKTSDIAKMGLSSLIRILLVKKFNTLPPLIKEFNQLISTADTQHLLDNEFKETAIELTNGFLKILPAQFNGPEDIVTLTQRMKELHEFCITPPEPDASIVLTDALNSEIYCSGDISIVGRGCVNSKIHAGGKVQIHGIFRGGEIYAAMGIEVDEVGIREEAMTRIEVPDGQTIKITTVMEGTRIRIGNKSHQFLHSENNVFARVDKDGNLLLH